jgi:hypothetical protein
MIQGASVRLQHDIPTMLTLSMRLLTIVNKIDTFGQHCGGMCWALTDRPAKENSDNIGKPLPLLSQAVLAMEPLDVLNIQLPDDIDTEENETGEKEMFAVGYRGNENRRAVPVVVVRYATSLKGLGTKDVSSK